jgi:hypothetical protein
MPMINAVTVSPRIQQTFSGATKRFTPKALRQYMDDVAALCEVQNSVKTTRVLEIILENPIVRGGTLIRLAQQSEINSQEVKKSVDLLLKRDLIEVTGETNELELPFAFFGTPPSQKAYLRSLVDDLKQRNQSV